jgi:DNA-binding NtrC family response regulator
MELEKKALIVEDDEETRSIVTASMNYRGYLCDLAENLSQGLDYVNKNKYAVIITDNNFPEKERLPEEPNMGITLLKTIIEKNSQIGSILIMYSGSMYGLSCAESMNVKTINKFTDNLEYCLDVYLKDQNMSATKTPCFFEKLFGE